MPSSMLQSVVSEQVSPQEYNGTATCTDTIFSQFLKGDGLVIGTLSCSVGMMLIVCRRRCVQILGAGYDVSWLAYATFSSALLIGGCAEQFWRRQLLGSLKARAFDAFLIPAMLFVAMTACVLGQSLAPTLSLAVSDIADLRSSNLIDNVTCIIVCGAIAFGPLFGIGAVLSRLMRLHRGPDMIRTFSHVWLAGGFSLGGLLVGLIFAARWIMPAVGTIPTMAIALGLVSVVMVMVTAKLFKRTSTCLLLLALSIVILTALGKGFGAEYRYGCPEIPDFKVEYPFFEVGDFGDVRVCEKQGELALQVNGVNIGGYSPQFEGEFVLAYLPRFLRPNTRQVLVLGIATGAACGVSSLFPGTQVSCAEENSAVINATEVFDKMNYQPKSSRSFALLRCGVQSALNKGNKKFDLILVNHSDLRLGEARETLTKQFYWRAKSRLMSGGLLAHRLNLASISPAGIGMIARTAESSFQHCGLVRVSDSEAILLASDAPLLGSTDDERVGQSLFDSQSALKSSFEAEFGTSNVLHLILTGLILDEGGFHKLCARDFETAVCGTWTRTPICRAVPNSRDERKNEAVINGLIAASVSSDSIERNFTACGCTTNDIAVCRQICAYLMVYSQRKTTLNVLDWALKLAPDDPYLLGDRLMLSDEIEPKILADNVERIAKGSIDAAMRVGIELRTQGRFRDATVVFKHLTKICSQSATLWYDYSESCRASGDESTAREALNHALSLDPCLDHRPSNK